MKKIKLSSAIYIIIFAVLFYAALIFFTDYKSTYEALKNISIGLVTQLLFFIILSLIFKFIRWHFYLKQLNININFSASVLVFLSGLTMTISPGKLGEFIKSYLLKEKYNIDFTKTVSVVLAERVIEFTSLLSLVISLYIILNYNTGFIINEIFLIPLLILSFFLTHTFAKKAVIFIIKKTKYLKLNSKNISEPVIYLNMLFSIKNDIIFFFVSTLAWVAEFFAFHILLVSHVENFEYAKSFFIYSASIVVGAVSFLPGGIGTTESSLIFFMNRARVSTDISIFVSIIIRVFTLWLPIIIGVLSLTLFLKKKS